MKPATKTQILNRLTDVESLVEQAKGFLRDGKLDEAESAVDEACDELNTAATTLTNEIDRGGDRKPGERVMRQVDGVDSSTRTCPCGASYEWSGFGTGLSSWMEVHKDHYDELVVAS